MKSGDASRVMRVEVGPKTFLLAALAVAGAWIFVGLLPVFIVVIVALILAGTLAPAVGWLEKRRVPRGGGIAIVFVSALGVTVLLGLVTVPSLVDQVALLVQQEPQIRSEIADALVAHRITAPLAEGLRHLQYGPMLKASLGGALAFSGQALEIVTYLVSAVFLALYIVIDRDRLRGGLFALVPRDYHIRLSRVLLNLETIVGGYVRGQLLTSALMAVFTFGLLAVCGVPNPLALAVFAGLVDVLPYVGVVLAIAPASAAAAGQGLGVVLVVLFSMLAYAEFESRLLIPRIYGSALRLPSSVVLVALLAGGTLGGLVGALLALPIAAAVRMLVEELRVALPGERVDDGELRAKDEQAEQEYERRAGNASAAEAAEIAVEISEGRRAEEGGAERAAEVPLTSGEKDRGSRKPDEEA